MTRTDFINTVNDFRDLKDFVEEFDCEELLDGIIDDEQYDAYVDEDIRDGIERYSWTDIKDYLNSLPYGWYWYRCNGSFDYDYMDEHDFQAYKEEVLMRCDDDGLWDEPEAEREEQVVPDEEVSFGDMLESCATQLVQIERAADDPEWKRAYAQLFVAGA